MRDFRDLYRVYPREERRKHVHYRADEEPWPINQPFPTELAIEAEEVRDRGAKGGAGVVKITSMEGVFDND